jgi:hypothetical protein
MASVRGALDQTVPPRAVWCSGRCAAPNYCLIRARELGSLCTDIVSCHYLLSLPVRETPGCTSDWSPSATALDSRGPSLNPPSSLGW